MCLCVCVCVCPLPTANHRKNQPPTYLTMYTVIRTEGRFIVFIVKLLYDSGVPGVRWVGRSVI